MLLVNASSAQALSTIIDYAKAVSVAVISYDQVAFTNGPLAQVPTATGTPVPGSGLFIGTPGKTVTIGLSNGSAANDWQTQSANDVQQAFDEAKANGWISKDSQLKIVNAGGDVNLQIQQALGLINQKVDMLLVNASSAQALSTIIDYAKAASIPVVSYDQVASTNAPLAQVPTATALPTTGFAEDAGVPMMLGLAVLLIVIIFLARRLRSA